MNYPYFDKNSMINRLNYVNKINNGLASTENLVILISDKNLRQFQTVPSHSFLSSMPKLPKSQVICNLT